MEVKAKLRYYRQSPRKVRLVTNLVRNLDVKLALDQLQFANKRASVPIKKLIESAVANAKHNFELDPQNLYIKQITVDDGPTLKRWNARAFGKSAQIRKRTSHISVILAEKRPTVKEKTKSAETPKQKAANNIEISENLKELKDKQAGAEKIEDNKKAIKIGKIDKRKTKGFLPRVFRRKAG